MPRLKEKDEGTSVQDVLNAAINKIARALKVIIYGYDGSNYQAIKTSNTGIVQVCNINPGGGSAPSRVSADVLSGIPTRASADILGQPIKVCDLMTGGAGYSRVSADILSGNNYPTRVSADVLSGDIEISRVSADILSGNDYPTRVSADILNKISAAITNKVSRVSADVLAMVAHKVSAYGLTVPNTKVSAIQMVNSKASAWNLTAANTKVSAIQVVNHKVSAIQCATHKVSAIQLANAKTSAIYVAANKVSSVIIGHTPLRASASLNAAGSATFIDASANTKFIVTDYDISCYADDAKFAILIGGKKITPWWKFKDGSGVARPFTMPMSVSANQAIKLTATAGSGRACVQYYK